MKYLVTGGAGFIGSHLADYLIENNHDVYIWDDLSSGNLENVNQKAIFEKVKVEEKEIGDYDFDAIFHLAAKVSIPQSLENPTETFSNVNGTLRVLEIARKKKTKVIYAGSSSAYFDVNDNPYAFTKYMGEEMCKMYNKIWGIPVSIMRFFNVYGDRQNTNCKFPGVVAAFQQQIRKGKPIYIYGDGKKTRDFVSVKDVVRGLYAASVKNWNGEIFNIASGKSISIIELAKMFNYDYIEFLNERKGEVQDSVSDISFSIKSLDWAPKESLQSYIERFTKSIF